MTGQDLRLLLADAVEDAERAAPPTDPVLALQSAKRDRRQRRGHLVVLAFAVFVVLFQLVPADAFGAYDPPASALVSAQGQAPAEAMRFDSHLAAVSVLTRG